MIVGPRGMTFNGFDFSPYLDANPTRPIMPPVEIEADEVPGADGTRFRRAKLGELKIPVSVRLKASAKDDIAELRHMLAAALWSGKPAPLVLGDDPARYHLAVLDGSSDLDRLWNTGRTELTFRACDPVAYGEAKSASVNARGTVYVGGTLGAYPVITAKPAQGESYRVTLVDTGEYVEMEAPFDGSQALVIDCAKQHCTLNGVTADRYVALSSDYFALSAGPNELKTSSGTAEIEWTERWL